MIRFALRFAAAALAALLALPAVAASKADTDAAFRAWLTETVRPLALKGGVSAATFAAATDGLALDWDLPDLAPPGSAPKAGGAFQAEFTSPGRYLAEKTLAGTASRGRSLAGRWAKTLAAVERDSGVPGGIILAIWGKESGFGAAKMPKAAIRTIATQAFMGARRDIFLPELVAALKIVEDDHLPLALMGSSWAGAMGQPQFLPSKFLAHAVDGDGDGRRDIWGSVPDTLASIGHYLKDHGWRAGRPWGAEVLLPDAVPCTLEGPDQGLPIADWTKAGVVRADGAPLGPAGDTRFLLLPAGRYGPAFLVTENFYVLKRYNESDVYALFVGHVADRIAGGGKIKGGFSPPSGFSRGDVRKLQLRLESEGHDVGGADGLVGFRSRVAIGRSQAARGIAPTCFPDASMLR